MNDTEKKRIIQKVVKLYALADGTNSPEEAESAVLMAQSILHEYNLTLSEEDFTVDECEKCFEHMQETCLQYLSEWIVCLSNGIARAFDCKVLHNTRYLNYKKVNYISLIGVEPDVSLAMHTFNYLKGVALRNSGKNKSTAQKNHWRIGFAHAVVSRIVKNAESKKQSSSQISALVVCKNDIISGYMNEKFPNIKTSKIRKTNVTPDAYISGYDFGQKVPLSTPVGAGKSSMPLTV